MIVIPDREVPGIKDNALAFDVALHLGTLVAVVAFFRKDLWKYFLGFFRSIKNRKISFQEDRIAWYLALGTIPGVIAGLLFADVIEVYLRSPLYFACGSWTYGEQEGIKMTSLSKQRWIRQE